MHSADDKATAANAGSGGLRAIARDAIRERLSDVAVELFTDRGFDVVTIEQIAAAAGVSTRSVYRYFPSKEDMVVGPFEANGTFVRSAFTDRPKGEPVLISLHAAYSALLEGGPSHGRNKAALRLMSSTPALRARNVEKHLVWAGLLVPVVATRLTGEDTDIRAHALVEASLAAFQLALFAWADDRRERSMLELLDLAFHDLNR